MNARLRRQWPRLAMLAVLAPLLALTTCYEALPPAPETENLELLQARALDVPQPPGWPDGLVLEGAWELNSPNWRFGSYSGMIIREDGLITAYSDAGRSLDLRDPATGQSGLRFGTAPRDADHTEGLQDIESATYDPDSGTIWLAFEQWHGIRALRPDRDPEAIEPEAMADWPVNGGAEAMTRLRDGRFIVMAERDGTYSRDPGEALLFPRDPLLGDDPVSFHFVTGGGFQPTGMAELPDGRVLILLRTLELAWPPFRSRLVIANPDDIEAGEPWPWQGLVDIFEPQLRENYEGVAVAPRADGGVTIWLISDDNAAQLQRTLLLKLAWMPDDRS